MKLSKNLVAALSIGLATAGISLENSVRAEVYELSDGRKVAVDPNRDYSVTRREREQDRADSEPAFYVEGEGRLNGLVFNAPKKAAIFLHNELPENYFGAYISLGPCSVTIAAPKDESVSVTFPKGEVYKFGIDGRYGDLTVEANDYSWISIQPGETDDYVPVIKTEGNFKISSGDMIKLDCKDQHTIRPSRAAVDFSINTPAFELLHKENDRMSEEIWFCDNFGRFAKTHLVIADDIHGKAVWNYHLPSDDYSEGDLYIATKAFARLEKKDAFWRNTNLQVQHRIRQEGYDILKRYSH